MTRYSMRDILILIRFSLSSSFRFCDLILHQNWCQSHLCSTERMMFRVSEKVKLSISTMSRIRAAAEKDTKKTAQAIAIFKNQLNKFVNVVVSFGALKLPIPQPSPLGALESKPLVGSTTCRIGRSDGDPRNRSREWHRRRQGYR
ncbi:hypothetical protein GIB67_007606 [Kingdonia uniflora]|uniref:Uncharacterized protein n=1 Tax=Kingdonia uniflora TaxID=39325 RepID=A0A7J7N1C5_9MAGN|nr:hypothetical protein GIB67_007606 [Kingdonia uniflora]